MCSTLFLLISKKQISSTSSTLFCLSLAVVLHYYNAVLYDLGPVYMEGGPQVSEAR